MFVPFQQKNNAATPGGDCGKLLLWRMSRRRSMLSKSSRTRYVEQKHRLVDGLRLCGPAVLRAGKPSHQVAEGAQIEVEFFAFKVKGFL